MHHTLHDPAPVGTIVGGAVGGLAVLGAILVAALVKSGRLTRNRASPGPAGGSAPTGAQYPVVGAASTSASAGPQYPVPASGSSSGAQYPVVGVVPGNAPQSYQTTSGAQLPTTVQYPQPI